MTYKALYNPPHTVADMNTRAWRRAEIPAGNAHTSDATVQVIQRLKQVYGLDLTARDSHHLHSAEEEQHVTPSKRVRLTGTIRVPLPPKDAFTLFTPTSERAWAQGWEPQFPSPVSDDTEPGTVFQTDHAGRRSTWTVIRRDAGTTIQYATTTPGDRAGLVTVTCQLWEGETTLATVSYDLTALALEANADLDRFAAHYPSFSRSGSRPSPTRSPRRAIPPDRPIATLSCASDASTFPAGPADSHYDRALAAGRQGPQPGEGGDEVGGPG